MFHLREQQTKQKPRQRRPLAYLRERARLLLSPLLSWRRCLTRQQLLCPFLVALFQSLGRRMVPLWWPVSPIKFTVWLLAKVGSSSCDNNCVNRSTKICDHTLAVAQLNGTLQEFITWYKRSKRGPNITNMAAAGGPKSAGRKPSKRKRSNAKTQPVLQQIDLLQHIRTNYLQKAQATLKQWVASLTFQPHLSLFKAAVSIASHLFLFKAAVNITSQLSLFKAAVSIASHPFLFKAAVNITFYLFLFKAAVSIPLSYLHRESFPYSGRCVSQTSWSYAEPHSHTADWHTYSPVCSLKVLPLVSRHAPPTTNGSFVYPEMAVGNQSLAMLWLGRSHPKSSVELPRRSYCDVPWHPSISAQNHWAANNLYRASERAFSPPHGMRSCKVSPFCV